MNFSSTRKPKGKPFVAEPLAPPPGAPVATGAQAILAAWAEYVENVFPEITALLRSEGIDWTIETSRAGLQMTVQHRHDRRFAVTLAPYELKGLRGRSYPVADTAKPGDRAEFVAEPRRRLSVPGASRADCYAGHDEMSRKAEMAFREAVREQAY
jgi:hypothetical protein